jgi:hypothetical protein
VLLRGKNHTLLGKDACFTDKRPQTFSFSKQPPPWKRTPAGPEPQVLAAVPTCVHLNARRFHPLASPCASLSTPPQRGRKKRPSAQLWALRNCPATTARAPLLCKRRVPRPAHHRAPTKTRPHAAQGGKRCSARGFCNWSGFSRPSGALLVTFLVPAPPLRAAAGFGAPRAPRPSLPRSSSRPRRSVTPADT